MKPDDALRQAAEWFAALHGGGADTAERARWQQWLAADPTHRAAWDKIEAVNQRFGALPAKPALAALNVPSGRRGAVKKLLALAAVGLVGAAASQRESRDSLAALAARERTAVGEMRRLALDDGSDLWINTDSALDLDFKTGQRRLALYRGEILLDRRAAAAGPPLVVDLGAGRLRAAATRFSVHRDGAHAALAVFEGVVRLEPAAGGAAHTIGAGKRLRFGAGWIGPEEAADNQQDAWIRRRLSVDRMRLDVFVADLARYWRGHIGCDPALAGMLLTGSYPLDDIGRVLAVLEKTLPLRVRRIMPWWVTLEPAV